MERLDPTETRCFIIREHEHRYEIASTIARGRVLDISCGIGYGAPIIVRNKDVTSYVGVDIAPEAIRHADVTFRNDRTTFLVGSALSIPLPEKCVDTIISLETLEHLADPEQAILEFARVLKPDGILVGSVPTDTYDELCESIYGPNEYHLQRFTEEKLRSLLSGAFPQSELHVVSFLLGSLVSPLGKKKLTEQPILSRLGSFLFVSSLERRPPALPVPGFLPASSFPEFERELLAPFRSAIEAQGKLVDQRDLIIKQTEDFWRTRLSEAESRHGQVQKNLEEALKAQEEFIRVRIEYIATLEGTVNSLRLTDAEKSQLVDELRTARSRVEATLGEIQREHASLRIAHSRSEEALGESQRENASLRHALRLDRFVSRYTPTGFRGSAAGMSAETLAKREWALGEHFRRGNAPAKPRRQKHLIKQFNLLYASRRKVSLVVFDLFDTLVTRSVSGEGVKQLWAERMRSSLSIPLSADEIYRTRARIEAALCETQNDLTEELEFQYLALCRELFAEWSRFPEVLHYAPTVERFLEISMATELAVEGAVLEPLTDGAALVEYIAGMRIPMALASDFYLPTEQIESLLESFGLRRFFERVYVSSSQGRSKRSGRLFEKILGEWALPPDEILMIGDNVHSDYTQPKQQGLCSLHLDRSELHVRLAERQASRKPEPEAFLDSIRSAEDKGAIFPELAGTLFYFTQELFTRLVARGTKRVLFLSREGEALRELFDLYQTAMGCPGLVRTGYLLASRKSTCTASLRPLDEEDFQGLFRDYSTISPREFLLSIGFPAAAASKILRDIGGDSRKRLEDFPESDTFHRIKAHRLFQETYDLVRTEQKELFLQHLRSTQEGDTSNEITIVDIGWRGTIQDNIRKILPEDTALRGLYLGLTAFRNTSDENLKEGLLFSPDTPRALEVYAQCLPMFEILLGASHGGVDRYVRRGGFVFAETHSIDYEGRRYFSEIFPALIRLRQSFSRICTAACGSSAPRELLAEPLLRRHARMVFMPDRLERAFIRETLHFENFGLFEFTDFRGSESLPLRARFRNVIEFLRSPRRSLDGSLWPALAFEQRGLSIFRLPYGALRFALLFYQEQRAFRLIERTTQFFLRAVRRLLPS